MAGTTYLGEVLDNKKRKTKVAEIGICVLYGHKRETVVVTVVDAVKFVKEQPEDGRVTNIRLVRFEVRVTYEDGNEIATKLVNKYKAVDFLNSVEAVQERKV